MNELGVWRKNSNPHGGQVFRITGIRLTPLAIEMIHFESERIDHYFLDPYNPTDKELLLLSIIEPGIHEQVVSLMEDV